MRLKLGLGTSKSITLEHLEEELYQVVAEERCSVEAKVGDMVMHTNVGWVIFRDKDCTIPRYRIPSQSVKSMQRIVYSLGSEVDQLITSVYNEGEEE